MNKEYRHFFIAADTSDQLRKSLKKALRRVSDINNSTIESVTHQTVFKPGKVDAVFTALLVYGVPV